MDLWIKSQDKEILCKTTCVDIMHIGDGYSNIFLNEKFPDLIVGTYTKERALEIIREIQNLLIDSLFMPNIDIFEIQKMQKCNANAIVIPNETHYIERNTIVYEMPQE